VINLYIYIDKLSILLLHICSDCTISLTARYVVIKMMTIFSIFLFTTGNMIYITLHMSYYLRKKAIVHHVSLTCIAIVYNKIYSVFLVSRIYSGLTYFTTNPQVQYNLLNMTQYYTNMLTEIWRDLQSIREILTGISQ